MKKLLFLTFFLSTSVMARQFCVAHRGNSSQFLENSMQSIMSAADMGVTGVEFDLHHTKDGIAILHHDDTLDRTSRAITDECQLNTKISEMQAHVIRRSCELKNGDPIPTLTEVLESLVPFDIKLFIELKDMPKLGDLIEIEKYYTDSPEKIIFISFDEKALRQVRDWHKNFPFFRDVKMIKLNKWGIDHFQEFDGIDNMWTSQKNIDKVRAAGKMVGVWTKDKKSKMKKYLKRGVDFITTNEPERCMKVVRSFNQLN